MEPPTGTVTFLFTDIEGSARLWEEQPEAMREALVRHEGLLHEAIGAHQGYVFKLMGDQFCVAFGRPTDALASALGGQRALQAEPWEVGPLKVRMALHTGEAEARGGDYFGPPLNRCARLLAAGHGGQVLLSHTAAHLVRDALPEGAQLRPLGEHRLRDLTQPEDISQLLHPDLPSDFPPLRSLAAFAHNLPLQLTSFVGREEEVAEVKRLLRSTRLLTLTGTGGAGKTRLALQVGADLLDGYPDGVWLVELAALTEAPLIPQAVLSALGLREEPQRPLTDTLVDSLRPKHALLILDNCEHVVQASAELAEQLLRSCAHVRIMATSREVLRADGEVVWRVPSLSLPSREAATPLEQLTQYEAVRLFIDRAMAAGPQFRVTNDNAPAVAEICWRLDGIPLAIELAAARVNVLAPEQIRERLDDRFRLLTNGRRTALPRQQTLRAAVEWSYALLPGREQRLFDRLSVLAGSFSLDAAETVCVGDGIDSEDVLDLLGDLVSRSLVVGEGGAEEPRYRVLETLRAYGSEQIDRADAGDALRRRHATFYFGLAKQAHAELRGPAEDVWLRRLEAEYDNLRAVLGWAETHEPEGGGRLVSSLGRFWNLRGQWAEARTWCDRYLAVRHHMAPRTAADIVFWAADLAGLRSDLPLARELWEECLALGRAQGDQRRVADALRNLGNICLWSGDYRGASRSFEESLPFYEQSGDKLGASGSLAGIATAAQEQGDYESAVRWYDQALATTRRVGSAADVAVVLSNLGNIALVQGEPSRARALHEEALGLRRGAGHRVGVAQSEICLGVVAEAEGDYAAALAHFQAALAVASELGDQRTTALAHRNLAGIHHIEGRWAEAGQECRRALSVAQGARDRRAVAACLEGLAAVAAATGDSSRGVRLFGAAESLRQTMGIPPVSFATDEYDRHTAAARDPLGDEAFQAAWAEGQGMSLDDAVAYALGAQDGE